MSILPTGGGTQTDQFGWPVAAILAALAGEVAVLAGPLHRFGYIARSPEGRSGEETGVHGEAAEAGADCGRCYPAVLKLGRELPAVLSLSLPAEQILQKNRSDTAPAVHTEGEINFAIGRWTTTFPTRDELVAASALLDQKQQAEILDQKRQAAIEYLEHRRSGRMEPNGSTNGGTQRRTDPVDDDQRGGNAGMNQLDEILGSLGDTQAVGEQRTTQADSQPPAPVDDRAKDRSFLLRAARSATERGNQKEADALLRSLAEMFPEQGTVEKERDGTIPKAPANIMTTDNTEVTKDNDVSNRKDGLKGSIMKIGAVSTAAANRTEKKTVDRADTEERRYTGTAAADEWSQSYAQWSRNYQGFIATLKEVYNFTLFSELFCAHRDRCDQIMRREGFCAGFRYDLAVRANAFQCDFVRNETSLFPDVSKFREDIAEETLAEAKRYGETGYIDNPYISGGKKENFDPHTGKEKNLYAKDRGDERGRGGNRFQSRTTPGRTRNEYQGSRSGRDDYDQDSRYRREDNSWGDRFRNRSGEFGYDDRVKDRSRNYKSQQGYRNDQSKGRKRYEPYMIGNRTGGNDESTSVCWPTEVKCEMNLRVWTDALKRAGLSEKYADVIVGFREGFSQGIPNHTIGDLRWYTPPNHMSADWAKEDIISNLKKEVAAGRMFGPFSHRTVARRFPFFRSSPLGAVANSDGSIRPINDLSFPHDQPGIPSVNFFVEKEDFTTTWDDFKTVANFFRQNSTQYELGLFDWEKAYRQIPTKQDQWPYLFVQDFDGNLLLDTRITFGGVAGCGSFGRPGAWKEVMMAEFNLVHVLRWVDDNLFVKLPQSPVRMADVVERSKEMGVKTNEKKYSEFAPKQKFIGFLWDGKKHTVELPPLKREARIQQIEHLLTRRMLFTYRDAMVIRGV
ncbi:hypothetical protein PSHT_16348 [Puccinia striiformis]|uniref:Reverse transcriptase domain-containing protein n=1 Tax=Puccinia striiformis TaxID=27350 RepID=A0A2S4UAB6_9BASI|nr:hypothetical protein PSHT_16348 [Puccinia striiformis]